MNALSYAGSHAGIFNTSSNPYPPATQVDEHIVLAKAVEAMNANPDFVAEVVVNVPKIETPPPECEEKLAPLYVELDELTTQIEDYSNVGEYMFNAKYPIAQNVFWYYSCANLEIWKEECTTKKNGNTNSNGNGNGN